MAAVTTAAVVLGLDFEADPEAAPWLPVLLPIAAYVEALKKDPNLALSDFLPLPHAQTHRRIIPKQALIRHKSAV